MPGKQGKKITLRAEEEEEQDPSQEEETEEEEEPRGKSKAKYTDEDMAGLRRGLERKFGRMFEDMQSRLDEYDKFNEELVDTLDEVTDELGDAEGVEEDEEEVQTKPGKKGEAPALDLKRNPQFRAMQEQIVELQKSKEELEANLSEAQEQAEEADEARLVAERDEIVREICEDLGVVNSEGALRYFRDLVVLDEENGKWLLQTGDDEDDVLPIEQGLKQEMPDFLKASKAKGGGTGGGKGTGDPNVPVSGGKPNLDALKQAALQAGENARKSGGDSSAAIRFMGAKKAFIAAGGNQEELVQAVTATTGTQVGITPTE